MKKLLLIAVAGALGGALVVAGSSSASADPYPGSVKTVTHITAITVGTVGANNKADVQITVNVTAKAGNADPTDGKINVKVSDSSLTQVYNQTVDYTGGSQVLDLGKFLLGTYTFTVTYRTPDADSIYKNSDADGTFTVPAPLAGAANSAAMTVTSATADFF